MNIIENKNSHSYVLEVEVVFKEIIEILCLAIKQRRELKFVYKSKSKGEEERHIRPYMIIPNSKKNLELVGIPVKELNKPINKRERGHYLLSQLLERIEMGQFEILLSTFDDLGAPRAIVDNTKSKVICRFIYDDENPGEVKKQWLQVRYI
jgi:hypothetical protein